MNDRHDQYRDVRRDQDSRDDHHGSEYGKKESRKDVDQVRRDGASSGSGGRESEVHHQSRDNDQPRTNSDCRERRDSSVDETDGAPIKSKPKPAEGQLPPPPPPQQQQQSSYNSIGDSKPKMNGALAPSEVDPSLKPSPIQSVVQVPHDLPSPYLQQHSGYQPRELYDYQYDQRREYNHGYQRPVGSYLGRGDGDYRGYSRQSSDYGWQPQQQQGDRWARLDQDRRSSGPDYGGGSRWDQGGRYPSRPLDRRGSVPVFSSNRGGEYQNSYQWCYSSESWGNYSSGYGRGPPSQWGDDWNVLLPRNERLER